jgi:hypothetical protein
VKKWRDTDQPQQDFVFLLEQRVFREDDPFGPGGMKNNTDHIASGLSAFNPGSGPEPILVAEHQVGREPLVHSVVIWKKISGRS